MPSTDTRIILAFDLDNMYVACERLRDPSLIGRPVGVQQKGLLATSSYEARALGVDKLCSLREAKKRCPSLIIVNGEDLTLYRYYSRRVFGLIRSIINGPVEKLGLDELFCDVSNMIAQHVSGKAGKTDERGFWFALDGAVPPSEALHDDKKGFWYRPEEGYLGHSIPPVTSEEPLYHTTPILIASHLALYIRNRILCEIGLAASAGVAHNKTLAKLVGNMHKPNMQTNLTVTPDAGHIYEQAIRGMLDPIEAHKLMGFGHKSIEILRNSIASRQTELHESGEVDVISSSHPVPATSSVPSLTVSFLRAQFTASQFSSILGSQTGLKLWNLLHGVDDEPVKASPDFPLTISVEDSFTETRGKLDWQGLLSEIEILSTSLLRRLEIELVEGGDSLGMRYRDGQAPTNVSVPAPRRVWLRYPSQIRLTLRLGHSREIAYNANRESRSVALPVTIFALDVPIRERAQALVKQSLSGLARGILENVSGKVQGKAVGTDGKWDICIINIAVTNLQTTTPTQSINSFFGSDTQPSANGRSVNGATQRPALPSAPRSSHTLDHAGSKRPRTVSSRIPPDLDLAVLKELPTAIRDEILREYGLTVAHVDEASTTSPTAKKPRHDNVDTGELQDRRLREQPHDSGTVVIEKIGGYNMPTAPAVDSLLVTELYDEDDTTSAGADQEYEDRADEETGDMSCEVCGATIFTFSAEAHRAFHAMS